MRNRILWTAVCLVGGCMAAWAADSLNVSTRINDVLVYRNGAMIYRSGTVQLPKGTVELQFDDLSSRMDESTLRLDVGDGSVVLSSVKRESAQIDDPKIRRELNQVEARLKAVDDSIAVLQSQIEVYKNRRDLILENKKIGGNNAVTVADLQKMSQFYMQELTAIANQTLALNATLKSVEERQKPLKDRQIQLKSKLRKNVSRVKAVVVSPVARKNVPVKLEYLAYGATWTPTYEMRVGKPDQPLQLVYNALVHQLVGEDWQGVKLTLSTGDPGISNNRPQFSKIELPQRPVPVRKTLSRNMAAKAAPNEAVLMAADFAVEEESFDYAAVVEDRAMATEFVIPLPYDIPSDGKDHRVEMLQYDIDARYEYSVMPRQSKEVWLSAMISDYGKYALQSGKVSLFVDNIYQGDSYLDSNSVEDTLRVSVGRDKDIVVRRTELSDYTVRRTVGSNVKVQKAFEITLKNNKQSAVALTVIDQVPVSTTSEIEVKVQQNDGAAFDAKTGKMTWSVTLQPGESRTLRLQYEVKYPKSMGWLRVD